MRSESIDGMLIPYGIELWSPDVHGGDTFPHVVVDPLISAPLRFNNSDHDPAPATAPAGGEEPDLPGILRDQVKRGCGLWNRRAIDFVDGYFGAVEQSVLRDEAAIAQQALGMGRLYQPRDWIYSALRPLPRAHLPLPSKDGIDRILVDFAFWTGRRFVAVDFGAGSLLPRAAAERERRLRQADIEIVSHVPAADGAWRDFLRALIDPPLTAFWQGETLPLGPFRSTALDQLETRLTP